MKSRASACASWAVPSLPGVECFRAEALTRAYTRHTHDAFAIGVIQNGTGVSRYRGEIRYFPARHVIAMNPQEPHTGAALDAGGLTYRMFYITPDAFSGLMRPRRVFSNDPCVADVQIADRLLDAHRALERCDCLTGHTLLYEALSALLVRHGNPAPAAAEHHEPRSVARAKEFLREHCARAVTIGELAAEVGLTSAHLIRAFRRATGVPPHLWLLQFRVELAKDRLASGQPIAAVAADLGFADQSHFTRRFRRITGLTPGQFAGQNRSIQ